MNLGEKIYKLRKEKGMSQELLAELLGTSRQAISKWENNQGFPEVEKIMILSNVFKVSTDYLLKEDNVDKQKNDDNSYYISRENGEGYLFYKKAISKLNAIGIGIMICSVIPFILVSDETFINYIICFLILMTGSVFFIKKNKYKLNLKKYSIWQDRDLNFDPNYYKQVKEQFKVLQKTQMKLKVVSSIFLLMGILSFIYGNEFTHNRVAIFNLMGVFLIALSLSLFIYIGPVRRAYEFLVNNSLHKKNYFIRLKDKIKSKI